jgi:hypothetical protein
MGRYHAILFVCVVINLHPTTFEGGLRILHAVASIHTFKLIVVEVVLLY